MLSMPKNPLSSLRGLFYPNSIAVVGASDDISKIGGYIFSQILNVKGCEAVPINIKAQRVQGKTCYNSIEHLPKKVDLVIVAIPAPFVLDVIEDCGKKGIKNVVIISAGFKEVGEEGKQREEKLEEIINKYQINIVGPNCLGFLNTEIGLNASFAKDLPNEGTTALISQSGAIIDAILDWSFDYNIGFSKVVSIGNMAGVNELDMLKYLKQDPKTKSIVYYMESLEDGSEFAKELKETSKKKPVIIIKPGNSKNAQKAIGSHTGSLAQNGVLVKEIITANNGILVTSIDELYNVLLALQSPLPTTDSLAIITNAGGPGVIATDALEKSEFSLAKISSKTKSEIQKNLPKEASVNNPIDVLGDATSIRYKKTIESLVNKKEIGAILVLLTPQIMTDSPIIAKEIVEVAKKSSKPVVASFLGGKELKESFEIFKDNQVPNFQTPEQAITSLSYLLKYNSFNYKDKLVFPSVNLSKIEKLRKELAKKEGLISYSFSKQILESIGIKLPEKQILESKTDILETNISSHKSYVLKAEGILHKKEENAIEKNITSLNFEEKALNMFSRLEKSGVSPQLTLEEEIKGKEVIVGLKKEGDLGSFIMFGTGGSYVSIYNDVAFIPAPATKKEIKCLIERTHISKLLKGHRGEKSIDMEKLEELLVKLSFLQEFYPEIKEVDCNPIICNEKQLALVDVKLVLPKHNK